MLSKVQTSISPTSPRIGVVLPVYRHSGLVVEALSSLELQQDAPSFAVTVVNDGCPYEETDVVCRSFAQFSSIANFRYLRRRNGGLSAARNSGIDDLLTTYPSIEAVYFLDADNRLKPFALAAMGRFLTKYPDADWFYPDIQMFGLDLVAHYDGVYSGLIHTSANISEAGSLVRRRVFEADVRFDEEMRQGFEDWDFWLEAREHGFRGLHVKNMGFEYRKRPESMLADSNRDEAEIKAYMRRKRRSTFQVQNLLSLETEEAPRYAVLVDGERIEVKLDPELPADSRSLSDYVRLFWCWQLRPDTNFVSPFVVCTSQKAISIANCAHILRWIFWDLEARCEVSGAATTVLSFSAGSFAGIGEATEGYFRDSKDAHFIMVKAELLQDICKDPNGLAWWDDVISGRASHPTSSRTINLSNAEVARLPVGLVTHDLNRLISYLYHSEFSSAKETSWKWAWSGVPARHTAYRTVRAAAGEGTVLPRTPDGRRHVAFVLSFVDFGGVEKVAINVARALRDAGYVPHLVMFRAGDVHLSGEASGVFESISWFTADRLLSWEGDSYYGSNLSWWSQHGKKSDAIGLLNGFDVVINCQSGDAHGVMGDLRRRGVVTITHQHLVESSVAGRPGGNAMLARAFEHSYALILTASKQLHDWFSANGVPQEKLLVVENASSIAIPQERRSIISAKRHERMYHHGPLRILFAARLDEQKGLDRLIELIDKSSNLDVEWRVVGKAVVEQDAYYERLKLARAVEDPVYEAEELLMLYEWADVLVLPSRYEGVPLTVIEAMSCGVVVLAADAGAVTEIIRSGVDGFVVSQASCVDEMSEIIALLSSDRTSVLKYSQEAAEIADRRSWTQSSATIVEYLNGRFSSVG